MSGHLGIEEEGTQVAGRATEIIEVGITDDLFSDIRGGDGRIGCKDSTLYLSDFLIFPSFLHKEIMCESRSVRLIFIIRDEESGVVKECSDSEYLGTLIINPLAVAEG